MELMESLMNLGLNEKEAKVYLALLPLDKATAYTIAIRSGLKNATAYVILDNLVNKGFALKIPAEDHHYFLAKSPKECLAIAREKLSTAEEMLPELMAIKKSSEEKPSVSFYEGIDGFKKMYDKLIKTVKSSEEKNFVAFYAHQKDTPEVLKKYWPELNDEYRNTGIKRKAITSNDTSIKKYLEEDFQEKYGMKMKALPMQDYSSNISIEIFDKFTQITSHRYIQGIVIENPDIADVMRQIFNLVWKLKK